MRNENIYCETACCDLRSLRNSGNSHRVPKLPVVLFLPARKMSMERVGQSGLKNLWSPKMLKVGALRLRWWHLVHLCPVCLVSRSFTMCGDLCTMNVEACMCCLRAHTECWGQVSTNYGALQIRCLMGFMGAPLLGKVCKPVSRVCGLFFRSMLWLLWDPAPCS